MKEFLDLYESGPDTGDVERIAKALSLPRETCAGWEGKYNALRSDPVRFMFPPWEPLNNWNRGLKDLQKRGMPGSCREWIRYNSLGSGTRVFHADRLKSMGSLNANYQFLYNIGPLDRYETAEERVQSGRNIIENNVITFMFKITKDGYKPYYLGPYTEHVSGGDKWSSTNYHYHTYWGYYHATLVG